MPHPIETWVRETERSQRRVNRQRSEPLKRWRPRPRDYVMIAGLAVLVCLGVFVTALAIARAAL